MAQLVVTIVRGNSDNSELSSQAMSLESHAKGVRFEQRCLTLLRGLGFEHPILLAEGPDRGKDIVCETTLRENQDQTIYRLYFECKDYPTSSVGLQHLRTKFDWAYADDIDALIVMTSGRFTSSVVDWLNDTRDRRRYPAILWDGATLTALEAIVASRDSQTQPSVREDLHNRIRSHNRKALAANAPLLTATGSNALPALTPTFVDRENELDRLLAFSTYSVAALVGASGMGKSQLAARVVHAAAAEGKGAVYFDAHAVPEEDRPRSFTEHLSTCSNISGCRNLAQHLQRYGWENTSKLEELVQTALSDTNLVVVIDNGHDLRDMRRLSPFTKDLARIHQGCRLIIIAPEISDTDMAHLRPDIFVKLDGLSKIHIDAYLALRGFQDIPSLSDILTERFSGWPLALSIVCAQDRTTILTLATSDDHQSLAHQDKQVFLDSLLSTLVAVQRETLIYVSLADVTLSLSDLAVLAGKPFDEIISAVQSMASLGLVSLTDEGRRVAVRHRQIAKALIASSKDLVPYHKTLARLFESRFLSATDAAAAVQHCLDANEPGRAVEIMVRDADLLLKAGRAASIATWIIRTSKLALPGNIRAELALTESRALESLGRYDEAEVALTTGLMSAGQARLRLPLRLMYGYHQMRHAYFRGEYLETLRLARKNRRETRRAKRSLSRARDAQALLALTWQMIGRVRYTRQHWQSARVAYDNAKNIHERLDDQFGLIKVAHRLAMIEEKTGSKRSAQRQFMGVLRRAEELGDRKREAYACHRLGKIARLDMDVDLSRSYQMRSVEIKLAIGHRRGLIYSYGELARLDLAENDSVAAEKHVSLAWRIAEELDLPKERAAMAVIYAELSQFLGKLDEQAAWYALADKLYAQIGLAHHTRPAQSALRASI